MPFRTHAVEGTFLLMGYGASLLRLPSPEGPQLSADVIQKIGYPEQHGICLAIPDVFTRGNLIRLRSDVRSSNVGEDEEVEDHHLSAPRTTAGAAVVPPPDAGKTIHGFSFAEGDESAALLAQRNSDFLRRKKHQVSRTLDPRGRYCNALIDDVDYWNPEFLSPFELFQRWRNFLKDLTGVLLVLGPTAPSDEELRSVLPRDRQDFFAAAQYVAPRKVEDVTGLQEDVDSAVKQLTHLPFLFYPPAHDHGRDEIQSPRMSAVCGVDVSSVESSCGAGGDECAEEVKFADTFADAVWVEEVFGHYVLSVMMWDVG